MADLSGVSLDDLRTEFVSLGEQLSTVSSRRAEILAEIESRMKRVAMQARIDNLSDDDRKILRDVIDAKSAVVIIGGKP